MRDAGTTPVSSERTLANCEAVIIDWEPRGLRQLIVWRDRPTKLKIPEVRTVRTLEAGDRCEFDGEGRIVWRVRAWR